MRVHSSSRPPAPGGRSPVCCLCGLGLFCTFHASEVLPYRCFVWLPALRTILHPRVLKFVSEQGLVVCSFSLPNPVVWLDHTACVRSLVSGCREPCCREHLWTSLCGDIRFPLFWVRDPAGRCWAMWSADVPSSKKLPTCCLKGLCARWRSRRQGPGVPFTPAFTPLVTFPFDLSRPGGYKVASHRGFILPFPGS